MRMFRYVAWIYLKYLFIVVFALTFLFAGLDYLQNADRLEGFNIKILYIFYKGSYAFDLLFPLTLVFAMIMTKIDLIRSNALVSFYALGYSKKEVLRPFILLSFLLTLLYIGMHCTTFVDAELSAKNLLHGKKNGVVKKNLFVKYDRSYIYIGELIPEKREARDIRIYEMKNGELHRIVYGMKADFENERWVVKDAKIVVKPLFERLGGKGFRIESKEGVETLYGFKPKILTSVFEGKQFYTIQAAYEAFKLLVAQGLDTQKVRSLLYHMTVTPFFALFLIVILFLFIPPYARSVNLFWISFALTGTALFVWGLFYLLFRISRSGVVAPEYGSVAIVSLLALFALHSYLFRSER